jgi:hypothetical protein
MPTEPFIADMGNPAANYCLARGGTLEDRPDGAVCHLPDGTITEEWTLFRADPNASAIAAEYERSKRGAIDPNRGKPAGSAGLAQPPAPASAFTTKNIALVALAALAVGAAVYYAEK